MQHLKMTVQTVPLKCHSPETIKSKHKSDIVQESPSRSSKCGKQQNSGQCQAYAGGHIIVETLWLVLQVVREEVVYHASHQRHLWLKNKL